MNKKVVLVAEDEAMILSLITMILQQEDFNVVPVGDPDTALLFALSNDIDLLLTDVQLGNCMTGIDLATRIRSDRPDLPVLLMSGFPDSLDLASKMGYPFLAKPFTPDLLIERIRGLLPQESLS